MKSLESFVGLFLLKSHPDEIFGVIFESIYEQVPGLDSDENLGKSHGKINTVIPVVIPTKPTFNLSPK